MLEESLKASKSVRFFYHFILKVLLLARCDIVILSREREGGARGKRGRRIRSSSKTGLLVEISS